MPNRPWRRARRLLVALAAFAAVAIDYHGDPLEYFCYFTVLTNLSVGLWFLVAAFWDERARTASVMRLSLTVYGLVTILVYWMVLSPTHHPEGLRFVANLVLHLVIPVSMAVEGWLAPSGALQRWAPLGILAFPLAYFAFSLVRGGATGWYPYFFLDPQAMGGWLPLGLATMALLAAFVLLGYLWRLVVQRKAAAP